MSKENNNNDLQALKYNNEAIFKRRIVGRKTYMNMIKGKVFKEYKTNIDLDNLDDSHLNKFNTFSELLSQTIFENHLTLKDVADRLNIELNKVHQIIDEEIFPWNLDHSLIIKICNTFDISEEWIKQSLYNITIDETTVQYSPNQIAARSQKELSSKELEKAMYDANIKIAIAREKEKRDKLIISL